ncbi:MAG: hypothetical protein HY331_02855 [Chloroflexi bacterium]|nr:hypothetical protein [Chloroflexota bacterium]
MLVRTLTNVTPMLRLGGRARTALAVAGPLAALTPLYTHPIVLAWATSLPYNSGDPAFITWLLMWNWHALLRAPWTLPDANIFYPLGGTAFFSDLVLPAALPFGAVYSLTGNPILAANSTLLLAVFLNGAISAWLAYRWTGDRMASLAGGAVAAFSPIMLAQLGHYQLIMFWWAPLALICLDSYLLRPRLVAGLGVVVCLWLQFMTAVYLSFYVLFACLIHIFVVGGCTWRDGGVATWLRRMWTARRRLLGHGAVLGAVGVALFLPPVAGYEAMARMWGAQRTVADVVMFSASPASFVSTDPLSLLYGDHPLRQYTQSKNDYEKHLFPGFVPLGLAAIALLHARSGRLSPQNRRRVLAALVIGVAAAVLALGPFLVLSGQNTGVPLPYLALYQVFPGFQAMRGAARFGLMAVPALSILAAFGVLALRQWPLSGRRRILPWALLGLLLIELLRAPIPMSRLADVFDPASLDPLARVTGPVIWLPMAESDPINLYLETARMVQNRAMIPMVNGYSGHLPPTYRGFQRLTVAEEPGVVAPILRGLGVRTVVLDTARLDAALVSEWMALAGAGTIRELAGGGRLRFLEIDSPALASPRVDLVIPVRRLPAESRVNVGLDFANNTLAPWVNRSLHGWQSAAVRWTHRSSGRQLAAVEPLLPPLYIAPGSTTSVALEVTTPGIAGEYTLEIDPAGVARARGDVVVEREAPTTSRERPAGLQSVLWLRADVPDRLSVRSGAWLRLYGSLQNSGQARWLAAVPVPGAGQVRVGYQWYPRGRETPEHELADLQGRIDLPRDVFPGEAIGFAGALRAPTRPGAYTLRIGAVAEGVAWFYNTDPTGRSVVSIAVTVTD